MVTWPYCEADGCHSVANAQYTKAWGNFTGTGSVVEMPPATDIYRNIENMRFGEALCKTHAMLAYGVAWG